MFLNSGATMFAHGRRAPQLALNAATGIADSLTAFLWTLPRSERDDQQLLSPFV